MTSRQGAFLLIVSALAASASSRSENLVKTWDLDLAKVLEGKGLKHTRDLPVLALRFSSDGSKLAAVVDLWREGAGEKQQQLKSYLLVIRADRPAVDAGIFQSSGGLGVADNGAGSETFGWTPSGRMIYAGGEVFEVERGKKCEMPASDYWGAFFLSDKFAMETERPDFGPSLDWKKRTRFTFLDADCQPEGNWEVPEQWTVQDVSPDRKLLSVVRSRDATREELSDGGLYFRTENLIVDPIARKVLQRWSGAQVPGGYFADSGKAICSGSDARDAERAPITCWEVDTGNKIGEAPTANGGIPMATALHAPRAVVADRRRRKIPFSYEYGLPYGRRVVWDFRAGKEIVSWRPQVQSYDFPFPKGPAKRTDEPYRFAISPDGQYIVEGGSGTLHLYKIEPDPAPGPGGTVRL
jgi:hypothetical protein